MQVQKTITKPRNLIIAVAILAILLLVSLYFNLNLAIENILTRDELSSERVTQRLEDLIIIPEEDPTIATIEDPDTLRQQNEIFYADAEEGHYLVVFNDRAIIYDAQEHKLINVAPIVDNTTDENSDPTTVNPESTDLTDGVEESAPPPTEEE
jgi:hypothetical protein